MNHSRVDSLPFFLVLFPLLLLLLRLAGSQGRETEERGRYTHVRMNLYTRVRQCVVRTTFEVMVGTCGVMSLVHHVKAFINPFFFVINVMYI